VSGTASGTGTNGSYAEHYYFAWKVVFTQTNTSNTTFQLEAQRTVIGVLYAGGTYNAASANLTVMGWQLETGFANFTTTGTVTTVPNGTSVPAVAMSNEHGWGSGNITEVFSASWIGIGGAQKTGYWYASVAASAMAQVSLQPALGLFPIAPYTGEMWNSMSSFNSSAEYTVAWHSYANTPWFSWSSTNTVGPVNLQGSGTVFLTGADYGTRVFGGVTAAVIGIALSGNGFSFSNHEGIILLPTQGNLFGSGGSTSSGAPSTPGTQAFGTSDIDVSLANANHGGIIAASSSYGSSSVWGSTSTASVGASSIQPKATSTTGTVQGYPMTVSAAQAWCLYNCPAGAKPNGAAIVAVLVIATVAVIAIVGIALILTRHRARPAQVYHMPPPPQTMGYQTYQNPPPPPPPRA
jgi:hypothetical protein